VRRSRTNNNTNARGGSNRIGDIMRGNDMRNGKQKHEKEGEQEGLGKSKEKGHFMIKKY